MAAVTGLAVVAVVPYLTMVRIRCCLVVRVTGDAREDLEIRRRRMAIGAGGPAARAVSGIGADREVWIMIPVRRAPCSGGMTNHAVVGESRRRMIGVRCRVVLGHVARRTYRARPRVLAVDVATRTRRLHVGAGQRIGCLAMIER